MHVTHTRHAYRSRGTHGNIDACSREVRGPRWEHASASNHLRPSSSDPLSSVPFQTPCQKRAWLGLSTSQCPTAQHKANASRPINFCILDRLTGKEALCGSVKKQTISQIGSQIGRQTGEVLSRLQLRLSNSASLVSCGGRGRSSCF